MNNSSFHTQGLDPVKLNRSLITVLAFLASVALAFFTIKTGNIVLMAGFLALPFVLMLMNRPDVAFLMGVIADASEINIAGLHYFTLGVLTQIIVVASVLLSTAFKGRRRGKR